MGLIHTPRVLRSIARGWIQRRNHLMGVQGQQHDGYKKAETTTVVADDNDPAARRRRGGSSMLVLPPASGLGPCHDRHIYRARAGIIDFAFGHLNNAAYLSHAELARWEMLSYSGIFAYMLQSSTFYVVAGSIIRYRKEIKPFNCPFRIESYFGRIDRGSNRLWAVHDFYIDNGDDGRTATSSGGGDHKSRAQLIVPCAWVRGGAVIDPALYFREAGVDEATIESLCEDRSSGADDATHTLRMKEVTSQYAALEASMRRLDSSRSDK